MNDISKSFTLLKHCLSYFTRRRRSWDYSAEAFSRHKINDIYSKWILSILSFSYSQYSQTLSRRLYISLAVTKFSYLKTDPTSNWWNIIIKPFPLYLVYAEQFIYTLTIILDSNSQPEEIILVFFVAFTKYFKSYRLAMHWISILLVLQFHHIFPRICIGNKFANLSFAQSNVNDKAYVSIFF